MSLTLQKLIHTTIYYGLETINCYRNERQSATIFVTATTLIGKIHKDETMQKDLIKEQTKINSKEIVGLVKR